MSVTEEFNPNLPVSVTYTCSAEGCGTMSGHRIQAYAQIPKAPEGWLVCGERLYCTKHYITISKMLEHASGFLSRPIWREER